MAMRILGMCVQSCCQSHSILSPRVTCAVDIHGLKTLCSLVVAMLDVAATCGAGSVLVFWQLAY